MWVEAEPRRVPTLPPTSASGTRTPRSSRGMRTARAADPAAAPILPAGDVASAIEREQEQLWSTIVLPAVTWLYGWIEWQINAKQRELPSIIEREHRAAFQSATSQVSDAIRSQPDKLSACIWRAMVALLTHFVSRVDPLVSELARVEAELAATREHLEALLIARQAQERAEEEAEEAEGEEAPTPDEPALNAMAAEADTATETAGMAAAPAAVGLDAQLGSRRGSMRRTSMATGGGEEAAAPSRRMSGRRVSVAMVGGRRVSIAAGGESEMEALREKVIGLQRELLLERTEKERLEERLTKTRGECSRVGAPGGSADDVG